MIPPISHHISGFNSLTNVAGPKGNMIGSVNDSFQMFMNNVQTEMNKPYKVAGEMMSGQKPFNSTELIMNIIEAQRKVNMAVRILNDTVRAVKQLEAIQA